MKGTTDEHAANRRLRMLTWLLKREIIICLHTYIFVVVPEQQRQPQRDRSNDASESSDTITTADSRAGGSPMATPSTPPRPARPPVTAVSPRVASRLKTSFAEPVVVEYQQSEALTFTSSLNLVPLVRLQEEEEVEKLGHHALVRDAAEHPTARNPELPVSCHSTPTGSLVITTAC